MRNVLLLLLVLAAFVAGCESKYKDPDPQAMGYDYYPLEIGQYRVYQVTDTRYSDNVPNKRQYQLRERVDASFVDQTGQEVYKIIRSIRSNEQGAWLDDSVMTVAKTPTMVVLTKDNSRYIKLVFPVKNDLEFVGDMYNSRQAAVGSIIKVRNDKEVYTYENVGESYDLAGQIYPTTTIVNQRKMFDAIRTDDRYEVYAEGIGMIHRSYTVLNFKSCRGDEIGCNDAAIESGHEQEEVLIDYGKL